MVAPTQAAADTPNALETVKSLMSHEAFDGSNPNGNEAKPLPAGFEVKLPGANSPPPAQVMMGQSMPGLGLSRLSSGGVPRKMASGDFSAGSDMMAPFCAGYEVACGNRFMVVRPERNPRRSTDCLPGRFLFDPI